MSAAMVALPFGFPRRRSQTSCSQSRPMVSVQLCMLAQRAIMRGRRKSLTSLIVKLLSTARYFGDIDLMSPQRRTGAEYSVPRRLDRGVA